MKFPKALSTMCDSRLLASAATAVIFTAFAAAPALALPSSSHYVFKTSTVLVSAGHSGHTTAKCPSGDKAVAGGVYWHGPNQDTSDPNVDSYVTASSPIKNRTAWYGAGRNPAPTTRALTVNVQCLPNKVIGSVTTVTKTVKVKPGGFLSAAAECPSTALRHLAAPANYAITGGVYWELPGTTAPVNGGYLSTLKPDSNFSGWVVAGVNDTSKTLSARITAACIPSGGDLVSSSGGGFVTATGDAPQVYEDCPSGTRAFAGGASWDTSGGGQIKTTDHLESTSVSGNGKFWYVSGRNNDGSFTAYFDYSVACLAV